MKFDHIVFASQNKGKIAEVKEMLKENSAQFHSGADLNLPDTDETATTFIGNAQLKSQEAYDFIKDNSLLDGSVLVLSDDSGLCVDALDGRPGVYTKRYSNEGSYANSENEYDRLMDELADLPLNKRSCQFVCIISAIGDNLSESFKGSVSGTIPLEPLLGELNIQYNPVFIPEGQTESFAQMGKTRKADFSHRGAAMRKAITGLKL